MLSFNKIFKSHSLLFLIWTFYMHNIFRITADISTFLTFTFPITDLTLKFSYILIIWVFIYFIVDITFMSVWTKELIILFTLFKCAVIIILLYYHILLTPRVCYFFFVIFLLLFCYFFFVIFVFISRITMHYINMITVWFK